MRKLFTFLLAVAFVALGNLGVMNAQGEMPGYDLDVRPGYYKNYHFKQNFNGIDALPDGWAIRLNNSAKSVFGKNGGVALVDTLKFTGAGSGARGGEVLFPTPQSNDVLTSAGHTTFCIELDWSVNNLVQNNGTSGAAHSANLVFLGSQSDISTDIDGGTSKEKQIKYADVIFSLYIIGTKDEFHCWNLDPVQTIVNEDETTTTVTELYAAMYNTNYVNITRKGTSASDPTDTDLANASTLTGAAFEMGKSYHIVAELDFVTQKVVALTITDNDDVTKTQTLTNMPFIKPATDLAVMSVFGLRENAGNNTDLLSYVDNFGVYAWEQSIGQAPVYIQYLDLDDNVIKAERKVEQQEVGLNFSLEVDDKRWFTSDDNQFYYAYDAISTGSGNLTVVADPTDQKLNTLKVYFKKFPKASGDMVWTGAVSEMWNQLDENFSVDGGATSIGFQENNGVVFSSESTINKEVLLSENINLGAGDLTISVPGYTITGEGKISGTGAAVISEKATLNVVNLLEGGVEFTADTLTLKNAEAGQFFALTDGVVLNMGTSGAFGKPIYGVDANKLTMVLNSVAQSSTVQGFNEINYILTTKGRAKGAGVDQCSRIDQVLEDGVVMNYSASPVVEGDTAYIALANNFPNNIVKMADRTVLTYSATPGKDDYSVIQTIGGISGTAGSTIMGPTVRNITYQIGGANTDEEFAGRIEAFKVDAWGNPPGMRFAKVGTGKWTLSGNSPDYNNNFDVNEGTLVISGVLGTNGVNMAVAEGATLRGEGGYLGSAGLTVLGTLEGTLEVETSVSLTNVLKMNVNNLRDGQYDVLKVNGEAYIDGVLEITASPYQVDADAIVTILDASEIVGEFMDVTVNGESILGNVDDNSNLPKFVYFQESGQLKYIFDATGVDNEMAEGKPVQGYEYYDLTGKRASENTQGFIIVKTIYTDGSVKNSKVFNK